MFSFPLFETLKAQTPEFEEVAAFQAGGSRYGVRRQGDKAPAVPLSSEYVTGNYFKTLGVGAFAGRVLTPADDNSAAAPAIVISHHAWEATYGGDPSIVGSTLLIEGHPFAVAGIAPAGFFGDTLRSDPPDLWIPLHQEPVLDGSSALLYQSIGSWLRVIGKLRPGASITGMGPRLTAVLHRWMLNDSGYPENWMPEIKRLLPRQTINVVPAGAGVEVMKEEYGRSLQILLAVCGAVLLIACANVANLLLARAAGRRAQTALRLAVGASRRQIITQALLESIILALAGGVAGLLVASAAARLLLALAFSDSHFLPISTGPSWMVLAFAFVVALLTGILFGAVPAWFATRTDPVEALRGAGRGGSGGDHSSASRKILLVVQATLSVVLVAGATMLARSLHSLEHQDFGYQTKGRVVVSLNHPPATYTVPKLTALYRDLELHLNQIPGVRGSGMALYNPLTDNWGELIMVAGHPAAKLNAQSGASWDRVSTTYLQNLGLTLQRGRFFTTADNETSAPVAIVNQAFVKRFFKPGENPLEQHFGLDVPEYAGTFRIIGVVNDAKFAGFALREPARPMFYAALSQNVDYSNAVMKRIEFQSHFIGGLVLVTDVASGVLEPKLRQALSAVDPNLTINNVRTLQEQVALSFDQERAVSSLASLFGVMALLLAAIGLYGVTAYTVAQKTTEIGIRMAIGASRWQVIQMVLRESFRRVVFGLILGLPLAVGCGRLIASQLYGVSFWDPLALLTAAAALAICAFTAAMIPARRAASISPMNALRAE